MSRGLISIAELIQGFVELGPEDAEARRCLREALYFEPPRGQAVPASPRGSSMAPPRPTAPTHVAPPAPLPKASTPTQLEPPVPSRLQPVLVRDEAGEALSWEHVEPLSPEDSTRAKSPPHEPLFARLHQPAILSMALSTRVDEGGVDVEKVVNTLATGRTPNRLPRLPVLTLRRGLQLLVDMGEGMAPYARDRSELLNAVRRHVRGEQVDVKLFAGCPSRGVGAGPRKEWRKWRPPARGTPVVLLSDLGIGEPVHQRERALPSEWLRFADQARRAGCPLVAIVPYEQRRWAATLRRFMAIIPWDRRTTALAAWNAIRDHSEVER